MTRHLPVRWAEDSFPAEMPEYFTRYLLSHAVLPELAAENGTRLVTRVEDLPEEFAHLGARALPAIVEPWIEPDGAVFHQLKVPEGRFTDEDGRPAKYRWASGRAAQLDVVRRGTGETALIVEGTWQRRAAQSWSTDDLSVFGIPGCWSYSSGGVPTGQLEIVEGLEVFIALDADASANLNVYMAGERLRDACLDLGAASVRFVRLAAGGKAGLDDVLAELSPAGRTATLGRMIERARTGSKYCERPADKRPAAKKEKAKQPELDLSDGRSVLLVSGDRLQVIKDAVGALREKFSDAELVAHGGAVSRVSGGKVEALDRGLLFNHLQEAAHVVRESVGRGGEVRQEYGWPDGETVAAILRRAEDFAVLEHLALVPFVRPDGSVRAEPGYDEATKTILVDDPALRGVAVPQKPTADETTAARDLLLGEWLGDFAKIMPTEADRANVLALVLTPFIRGLVPLVPLAVIDGLCPGVGKNLLADVISILVSGHAAQPLPYTTDDAEHRKVITSAFRSGSSFFVFDEAHILEGASFSRALTSIYYEDRILATNVMGKFPNRVTWMSLGNAVRVEGDLVRRYYTIALKKVGERPQDRPASSFRHTDLRAWTAEHRAELLSACLTLVRAWFAAGSPDPKEPAFTGSFGSFEKWQEVVGGILGTAGVPGFLGNLSAARSESGTMLQQWALHLDWLLKAFGDQEFTSKEAAKRIVTAHIDDVELPPGLEDRDAPNFAQRLGREYRRMADRVEHGLALERRGNDRLNVARWGVRKTDDHPSRRVDESGSRRGKQGTQGSIPPNALTETFYFSDDQEKVESSHSEEGGSGSLPLPASPADSSTVAAPAERRSAVAPLLAGDAPRPSSPAALTLVGGATVTTLLRDPFADDSEDEVDPFDREWAAYEDYEKKPHREPGVHDVRKYRAA